MNIQKSLYTIGAAAKKKASQSPGGKHSALWSIAQAINGAIHGLAAQFGGVFSALAKAADIYSHLARGVDDAIADRLRAVVIYLLRGQFKAIWQAIHRNRVNLMAIIQRRYLEALGALERTKRRLILDIAIARQDAYNLTHTLVDRAQAMAKREIRAMHRTIEQEAASGYRTGYRGRVSEITKVADFLANYNPLTRNLIGDLITGVLDLATIDDPLARLLLSAVMKHIIDHLAIDKAVGHWLDDLLAPILGQPRPLNLHDVIMDISQRLAAGEAQWSQFYADGGSQVEQAGRGWQEIISPVADVAIVAWLAEAYAAPTTWASQLSGTIGVVANDVADKFAALMKGI